MKQSVLAGDTVRQSGIALDALYARFDAIAEGRAPGGDSGAAHRAVLTRLTDNEAVARREGWSAFTLRRLGGTGRLYLEGTRPDGGDRGIVPDWLGVPSSPLGDRR